MVEEVRAKREVSCSNRVGRVAMKFTRKMSEMGGCWLVGASIDKKNSIFFWVKIPIFSGFFSDSTLPSVGTRTKDTRQRRLCRRVIYRVFFAECKLGFAECL